MTRKLTTQRDALLYRYRGVRTVSTTASGSPTRPTPKPAALADLERRIVLASPGRRRRVLTGDEA
jgi:hypothetical protein